MGPFQIKADGFLPIGFEHIMMDFPAGAARGEA
jgi:hypothetical protein